jgi:hypothetical protein
MKLVVVLEVSGIDPQRVDPHEVAEAALHPNDLWALADLRAGGEAPHPRFHFVRAEWADQAARGEIGELLDEEDE